ncbi:SpoIIE family protein phosphatase [Streptomyces sp. NPDC127036]|uniref:SpoIIE family protein phosphatase n=1 Tax=unclassified Streptomyces TaxID=2593676 RepID=UPI00365FA3C6
MLADVDLTTGHLTWISRGHPQPILIRDDRWTTTLSCQPARPMGTCLGLPVT